MKIKQLFYITMILLLGVQNTFAQQTIIKGKVIDAETGDPIPFANVIFQGTQTGMTTDFEGYYTIKTDNPTDSVSASYVGYVSKSKLLKKGITQHINFQLHSDLTALQELVFVAGEDPAVEIMRRVVKAKKKNDKRSLDAYEYDSYTKTEFDVNNLTEKLKSRKIFKKISSVIDSLEQIAGEDGKPVLPLLISEALSKFYVKFNPKVQKELILNTKVTGVGIEDGGLTSQLVGSSFQQYNFYINWVDLVNKKFISPMADGGKTYYDYYLTDSMYLGKHFCYQIEVYPKSPQDLAFTGKIWITKNEYALKQIDVYVPKTANLNYIEKIKIQQELEVTKAGAWLPSKNRVVIDVGQLTKNTPSMVAKFYNSNKNFVVNVAHDAGFYEPRIEVDENARLQPKGFWIENRHDSLTATEMHVYAMIDTLKNIPVIRTYTDVVKTLATGYLKVGKIDFGPYIRSFAQNKVEGIRLGLGARTNINFSNKWVFTGYAAYGFDDKKWKYLGAVDYIISRKPWTKVGIERRRDVDQIWTLGNDLENGNLFFAFRQFGTMTKPFDHTENTFYFKTQVAKGLNQKITLKQHNFNPLFQLMHQENPSDAQPIALNNFSTTEISFETRFGNDELFIQNDNVRLSLGALKWPIFSVKYTHGFNGFLGGDYNYDRLNANMSHALKLGLFGVSRYSISGGYIFQKLPYPLLKTHIGNENPFYNSATYNLMDYFEFVSDHYASFRYRHSFEGFILNRVPLMKKLKWRLVGSANVLFGGVRKENLEAVVKELDGDGNLVLPFRVLSGKPYIELGYGIENIFKILRVDAFHRITYLDGKNVRKFGVKFSFQFIL